MKLQFIDETTKREIEGTTVASLAECPLVGDSIATREVDGTMTLRPVTQRIITYSLDFSIEKVEVELGMASQWLPIFIGIAQAIGEQYHPIAKATAMAFLKNGGISAEVMAYCLEKFPMPSYPSLLLKECLEAASTEGQGR